MHEWYGHDPAKRSEGNVFFGNIAGAMPEGSAAFNVAHGSNQGDYWFGNALEGGKGLEFDVDTLPRETAKVAIFQPGGE